MTDLNVLLSTVILALGAYALTTLRGNWARLHYRDRPLALPWTLLLALPTLLSLILAVTAAFTAAASVAGPLMILAVILAAAGGAVAFLADLTQLIERPLRGRA